MRHIKIFIIFRELFFFLLRDGVGIKINDGSFKDTFFFIKILISGFIKMMGEMESFRTL
jgi:hypothetical protein